MHFLGTARLQQNSVVAHVCWERVRSYLKYVEIIS